MKRIYVISVDYHLHGSNGCVLLPALLAEFNFLMFQTCTNFYKITTYRA